MHEFSYFMGGITETVPKRTINPNTLTETIIKSEKTKREVLQYRSSPNSQLKNGFNYVCFSGVFAPTRSNANLQKHSGLICMDIDHVEQPEALKAQIITGNTPILVYTSVSGNGLKAVYSIDIAAAEHIDYFKALENYLIIQFGLRNKKVDPKCSDVSRAAFISWDENVYLNENAATLNADFISQWLPANETIKVAEKPRSKPETATDEDVADFKYFGECEVIRKGIENKGHKFTEGQRNAYITALLTGFNRVGIPYNFALNYASQYKEPGHTLEEIKATARSIYGRKDLHGTNPLKNNTVETPSENLSWKNYLIDLSNPIAPPEPLIIQDSTDIPMLHRRNLSTVAASAKVGKTFLLSGIAAAALNDVSFLGLRCPKENVKVLFIDTEMDASNTQDVTQRVHRCNGWDISQNVEGLTSINLRTVSTDQRADICESAIIDLRPDLVLLDGISDLVSNFNDIEPSKEGVERLTKWATMYDCHVMTCLHVNKNNAELRGHLGAFLRQKGELTLLLTKKENVDKFIEVKAIDSRHRPIDDFNFRINAEALPEVYEPLPIQKEALKVSNSDKLFSELLTIGVDMARNELKESVMKVKGVKKEQAYKDIAFALENSIIMLNNKGRFVYNLKFNDDLI